MKKIYLIINLLYIISSLSITAPLLNKDNPEGDSFFRYTHLIMTRQEIEIYKHLPDNSARLNFIEEFWEKRDPTPETELNENKIAFTQRIQYANKWFHEGRGTANNRMGYNTLRGRIFLQIGPPTIRQTGNLAAQDGYGHLLSTKRANLEIWNYYNYNLILQFIANQYNEYEFWGRPPAALGRALREAKNQFNYDNKVLNHKFKFTANYKNGQLHFKTPTKKLSFQEEGEDVVADFHVDIYLYEDNKKLDKLSIDKRVRINKEAVLSSKNLEFSIPLSLKKKKKYYLEIILKEVNSGLIYRYNKSIRS